VVTVGKADDVVARRVEIVPLTPRAKRVLVLGSMCSFVNSLNLSIMYVAFPDLTRSFPEASAARLSWVLNAYTVVAAATLVLAGVVADRWGRRRTLLTGVTVFATASAVCALAPTTSILIGARAVQAVGSALITPASIALILDEVPTERRATAIATWGAIGAAAAAAGPSLGAVLIDLAGWRAAFWVSVPIAAVVVPTGWRTFRESRDPSPRPLPDVFSVLCLMTGVSLVILALTQSDDWGWGDGKTLASLGGGVLLVAVLLVRSALIRNPVLDLALFRHPALRVSAAASLLYGMGFFAMFFGTVLFLRQVWGYSTVEAGLLITPVPVATAFVASFAGRVADRHGHRRLMIPGGALFTLGALFLVVRADDDPDPWATWLPAVVVLGLGSGMVWPAIHGAAVHGVPGASYGSATAINQTVQRVGTALGVATTISLVAGWDAGDGVGGFRSMFWLMAGSGAAAILLGTRLRTAPGAATAAG
jgi:EmrB/QacA subfamily drug resistance transporter